MKTLHILVGLVIVILGLNFTIDPIKKETVKVLGNCDMCKSKIEKAAKSAGAVNAVWNTETKLLSVSYNSTKTSLKAIEEKIANAGYDTKDVLASKESYSKLPKCCQYERSSETGSLACCKVGATCCKEGSDCCSKAATKDCCKSGKACCSKDLKCCSKPSAASALLDCCKPGAKCCNIQRACCVNKTSVALVKDCCETSTACCNSGQTCCSQTAS